MFPKASVVGFRAQHQRVGVRLQRIGSTSAGSRIETTHFPSQFRLFRLLVKISESLLKQNKREFLLLFSCLHVCLLRTKTSVCSSCKQNKNNLLTRKINLMFRNNFLLEKKTKGDNYISVI